MESESRYALWFIEAYGRLRATPGSNDQFRVEREIPSEERKEAGLVLRLLLAIPLQLDLRKEGVDLNPDEVALYVSPLALATVVGRPGDRVQLQQTFVEPTLKARRVLGAILDMMAVGTAPETTLQQLVGVLWDATRLFARSGDQRGKDAILAVYPHFVREAYRPARAAVGLA